MKILSVTNNPNKVEYDKPTQSGSDTGWNMLPSLFVRHGIDFLGIGLYELKNFYSVYLKFKPDLIIVEWIPAALVPILFKQLRLVKCPITHNWGDYYAEFIPRYPAWLSRLIDKSAPAYSTKGGLFMIRPKWLLKFMEYYSVKHADFVTTVSRRNEALAKKYGKKVHFIPHGYWPAKPTRVDLSLIQTGKDHLKVVYVGSLSRGKFVDVMIEGVRGLKCDLFLFGRPNPELEVGAPPNVHFMGYVDETEVISVLKQADIVTSMNDQDCNYKFIEFIAARKPILTHDGLPANVFKHRETAYLTKDFRSGLLDLLQDEKLRHTLSDNMASLQVFTWDEIIEKYIGVYQQYLANHKQ